MPGRNYTIEELMLDDSFLNFCLDKRDADRAFWEREMEFDSAQKAIILEAKFTICLLHGKLTPEEVNGQVTLIKGIVENQKERSLTRERRFFSKSRNSPDNAYGKSNKRKAINLLLYSSMIATVVIFMLYFFANPLSKNRTGITRNTTLYKTGMGQRLAVALPDGSTAILNSNSQMIISADFNTTSRPVILNGQAYFHVAKDEQKKFTVKCADISATALGTSFYVTSLNNESRYSVDLLEGQLKLASIKTLDASQSILNAGEKAVWERNNNLFSKQVSDQSLIKNWIKGKLAFTNMAADDVFSLLSRWYGVKILATHPRWSTVRLTGDYDQQSLDEVLSIVCFSLSTSYSYKDNMVIIE